MAILGGGIAGLTLALQLKQQRPAITIAVIEKQPHPVPEAAHKVGESSVEVQAYYLRDVLGLQDHLESQQLRKFGLRMFFSTADNRDIARRVEYGQIEPAPLPSYQLDRGRLENAIGEQIVGLGVSFLAGHKVQEIALRPEQATHLVRIADESGHEQQIAARWVVDGSGRSSLLKRQLGLAKKVEHHANSVWFRVGHRIDLNDWSDDQAWKDRICSGERSLSTNHLMGHGYWVWMIPLASGSTSIGIVADADIHDFSAMNRFDRALEWLHAHEPQCAEAVEQHREQLQDFRVMKDYSYSCQQVYSTDRWCLIGEAAVSIDPLYSSGGDLIAIGNGLVCDLINRSLDGEEIEDRLSIHNQLYLILAEVWLSAYQHQYPLMGNAQVMVAKVVWDTIIYWAFPGLLYFHDTLRKLSDRPGVFSDIYRCWKLHTRVQVFFREWHAIDQQPATDTFADPYSLLEFLVDLHTGMAAGLPDDELELQFAKNTRLLEQLAGQLVSVVSERVSELPPTEAIQQQVASWQAEPLLAELVAIYREQDKLNPIDSNWITLGQSRSMPHEEVV
ncbi:halogenase [Chloroflexia bacterium SDU3-3]|nr:halogenase [Chloroflexia bacterium SDU3-3]